MEWHQAIFIHSEFSCKVYNKQAGLSYKTVQENLKDKYVASLLAASEIPSH